MKLSVHVRSQFGTVQAFCPDLPGCSATASTESEALTLLRGRVSDYFAAAPAKVPGTRIIKLEV